MKYPLIYLSKILMFQSIVRKGHWYGTVIGVSVNNVKYLFILYYKSYYTLALWWSVHCKNAHARRRKSISSVIDLLQTSMKCIVNYSFLTQAATLNDHNFVHYQFLYSHLKLITQLKKIFFLPNFHAKHDLHKINNTQSHKTRHMSVIKPFN